MGDLMPTDLSVVMARKAKAKRDQERGIALTSLWLILYGLVLAGSLTEPVFARVAEYAALY
jgi:hypothetical protein